MWIESHTDLREHHKVIRLSSKLGKDIPTTLGHLHLLWWATAIYRISGDITAWTDNEIAVYSKWQGDAKQFVTALISEHWLDRKGKRLYVHDWKQYCGELIRKRLAYASEKSRRNSENSPPTNKTQQTTPYQPNKPDKQGFNVLREQLLKLGFTARSVAPIMSYGVDVVAKAIAMSEGKKNAPGYITDALKKGWVK